MATRFRLAPTATPPVSPPFSAGWEVTSTASRYGLNHRGTRWKIANAVTSIGDTSSTAVEDVLHAQFISPPLDSNQTITGTIKGQIRVAQTNAAADCRAQLVVYVVDYIGTTVRGTLLDFDTSALSNEFVTATHTNRKFPLNWSGAGTSLGSVNALEGDRIVIEVGARTHNTTTTIYNTNFNFADDSVTDLPEDESTTTANNPWIEFSQTITFRAQETGSLAAFSGISYGSAPYMAGGAAKNIIPASRGSETFRIAGIGTPTYYINRVYDSTAGKFVRWITPTDPDPTGANYPGPGTFGVHTSDYVVVEDI